MIPRDRSKYGSPFPGLPSLPDLDLPDLPDIPTLPTPFYHFSVTGGDSWADAMHAMEDACERAQRRLESRDECHHCGAPSPGKRCRYCGTGEAPALPPDPRFCEPVVNADGKTIGYITR